MKKFIIKDIDRKTSIPKAQIIRAVEKVYGVKLSDGKQNQKEPSKAA
jgi:ribosome-binding protein aMBF1 (putative translation factor)